MNQSNFRPVKYTKMTVWTSVLWEIDIQLAKKWPEMVVKLAIVIVIRFYSDYSDTQRSPIKDNQVKKSWTKFVLFSKNHIINHFGLVQNHLNLYTLHPFGTLFFSGISMMIWQKNLQRFFSASQKMGLSLKANDRS